MKLPYPITHLHELLSTADEWHNLVIGFCLPACKIWRVKAIIYDLKESHYFMFGVLLSTMTIAVVVIGVIIWLL